VAVSTFDDSIAAPDYAAVMRERRTMVASVLMLVVGLSVATASAALAASGLPATISMEPATAGPGETVEVAGLDFPAGGAVDLQATTPAGRVHLATVEVADGGYFRQSVTLPADGPPGFWELRATTADGVTAALVFEAVTPPGAVEPAAPVTEVASQPAAAQGNSPADIMVMLIIALLIAAVGGALVFAWQQTRAASRQPGMGAGDDPIWSGANFDTPR
jgi:hypothetical protein